MINLKHRPLIAEMLSGFLMLGLLAITFWDETEGYFANTQTPQALVQAGLVILSAWIIGTFFDAFRNGIVEEWLLREAPLNWDFFFYGKKEQVAQFEEYWWAYYELDADLVVAILFFNITWPVLHFCLNLASISRCLLIMTITIFVALVFARDAWVLRKDCRRLMQKLDDGD